MPRTPRLLIPAGVVAGAIAVAACVPPPADPASTTAPATGATTAATTLTTVTTVAGGPPTSVPDGAKALYNLDPLQGWGVEHPNPGVSFNGVVYGVEIVGDTVYAGGTFVNAQRFQQLAPRTNLMAVRRSTGELLPFAPAINGTVYAVVSDGTSLYIGGDFTTVNGTPHARLAKLDLATGAVDPAFNAGAPNLVRDLAVAGGRLYIGGEFHNIGGSTRNFAAAVNKATGALDPGFNPDLDKKVMTVTVDPKGDKVYLGGDFTTVGGTAQAYLAAVDAASGALVGPAFKSVGDRILDISVKPDSTVVYGAGGGGFNSAAAWDAKTGSRKWVQRADGDTQAVVYSNGYVYMGFHDGFQDNVDLRLLALDAVTGAPVADALGVLTWAPVSGSYPGVLTLDADGDYLAAGGWFPRMGAWQSANGLSVHGS